MNEESQEIQVKYVGFGMRVVASVVDSILSALLIFPFIPRLNKLPPEVLDARERFHEGTISSQEAAEVLNNYMLYGGGYADMLSNSAVEYSIAGLVIILFWVFKAATPGKMLLGMRIVDVDTNQPTSTGRLIARYVGYIVSTLPLLLGFFWVIIDKRKQAWHDKIANTAVVYAKSLPKTMKVEGE